MENLKRLNVIRVQGKKREVGFIFLTPHLPDKELGGLEHLHADGDVGSVYKVAELLRRELDRHPKGSHEESEAAGARSASRIADPTAADA